MEALQTDISSAALEHAIDTSKPFPFLIFGKAARGKGHIMFKDTLVRTVTPAVLKDANHANTFTDQYVQMLGFYSQHHQAVFTHHNSYMHIHYRLGNRYQAGHLDEVAFDPSVPIRLLFPRKTPQK
jgi:acetolactate decarboxylase